MKKIMVHKARSFADAARWDRQFWRRAGAAVRLAAVWSMVGDWLKMQGKSGVQPRLRRTVQHIKYL